LFFYSYYNGPQSDGPLEGSDHAQILLQSGDKLGVDLTSPLFADQTKCYADPFELYTDPAVKFRSICYKNGPVITDIFWVRNDISLQSFVEQNVDVIARQRARDGSLNTDQKIINVIESKDDVVYHSIQIGDDFYAVQGTFFVVTKQASDMEVNLAVVVKAVNLESAKQRIEEIKSLSLQKNQVSKIHVPFNFIHRAHAGAGGDGGPGGNGGGSSSSPGLTDGSGSAVVDGSGNAVGTGAASTGTNGNDGSGAAGTGTSVTPAVTALFTATPGTINPNDSANLTWTVTGATSCIAGGGWSGAQTATNGTHSFAVSPESTNFIHSHLYGPRRLCRATNYNCNSQSTDTKLCSDPITNRTRLKHFVVMDNNRCYYMYW
jgi:hypothetical protein